MAPNQQGPNIAFKGLVLNYTSVLWLKTFVIWNDMQKWTFIFWFNFLNFKLNSTFAKIIYIPWLENKNTNWLLTTNTYQTSRCSYYCKSEIHKIAECKMGEMREYLKVLSHKSYLKYIPCSYIHKTSIKSSYGIAALFSLEWIDMNTRALGFISCRARLNKIPINHF